MHTAPETPVSPGASPGTASSAFARCFELLIGHEGGFTADARDPGNWTGGKVNAGELKGTKFGISAAVYRHLDIANLTLDQAREIYHADFWRKIRGDELPPAVALCVFDAAVHAGLGNAARWLQASIRITVDGVIGSKTIEAVRARPAPVVLAEMLALRAEHNRRQPTIETFGLGWSRRLFALAFQAAELHQP